mmetsp:Transcript_41068/g.104070  ORF Transcript_41068/g.104070 Transcript_41068/m.104070 type:complete len:256 (-) Transcript_41068:70-837(-)
MPPRVATRTDGPSAWFEALPPVTKLYMCLLFGATLGFTMQLVSPAFMALLWDRVIHKFEVWRLVTNFLFLGPFGLHFFFMLLFLHNYGCALEVGTFVGRSADYVWVYVFAAAILLSYSFLGYMRWVPALVGPFNAEPIIYTLLFVWSRNFAEQSVSIYGLFKLQAFYMPFAMLALSMVMGASPLPAITGILIGHLYHFASSIVPRAGGTNYLSTPQWLKNAVHRSGIGTVNPAEVTAATGPQARAFSGRARRLAD